MLVCYIKCMTPERILESIPLKTDIIKRMRSLSCGSPYNREPKYPRARLESVPVTAARSRRQFLISQLVSGNNAQAWHAA